MLDANFEPSDKQTLNDEVLNDSSLTFNSLSSCSSLSYSHLITTQPHSINRVVISDLHLSANQPALVQAFLALLDDLIALPNIKEFYILGDWFDAWIGDDAYLALSASAKAQHWITPIITKLGELSATHCKILIMHGNRDFLIGQNFCDTFNGVLIPELYFITVGKKVFRLEHGDALCIDDKAYQLLRKVLRNRLVQWFFLRRPLAKRQQLANKMRMKSQQANQNKSEYIMDVNADAVIEALQDATVLLHGHTHRPAFFKVGDHKKRYVLGDWRIKHKQPDSNNNSFIEANSSDIANKQVEAVIGLTTIDKSASIDGSADDFDPTKNLHTPISDDESGHLSALADTERFCLVKYLY